MTTVKERFPARGDTVTLQAVEKSPHSKGVNHLIYKVKVFVISVHPKESLLIGVELRRFCYFEGEEGNKESSPQRTLTGHLGPMATC